MCTLSMQLQIYYSSGVVEDRIVHRKDFVRTWAGLFFLLMIHKKDVNIIGNIFIVPSSYAINLLHTIMLRYLLLIF